MLSTQSTVKLCLQLKLSSLEKTKNRKIQSQFESLYGAQGLQLKAKGNNDYGLTKEAWHLDTSCTS